MKSNFSGPYMNFPNFLTTLRLALSPLLAVFLIFDASIPAACYWALMLAVIAEITDLLDGYMARKYKEITDLGKILDPMSDSIYRCTAFISLAVVHQISPFLVLPILYRDSMVMTLRIFCAQRSIVVAARWSGKIKALFQGPVIIIILLLRIFSYHEQITAEWLDYISNALMAITCLVTLYSAYDYFRNLFPRLMEKQ